MKISDILLEIHGFYEKISDKISHVTDIMGVYLISFFKFRMPVKRSGQIIYKNNWVVNYTVIMVKLQNVESEINYALYNNRLSFIFEGKAHKELSKCFSDILKSTINIKHHLSGKDEFFFTKLQLQPFSEYITEQRNLQIKNLLNEE